MTSTTSSQPPAERELSMQLVTPKRRKGERRQAERRSPKRRAWKRDERRGGVDRRKSQRRVRVT